MAFSFPARRPASLLPLAYATDVWYSDPPDPSCPLLKAPNMLMAPHIGASSKENLLRIGDTVVEILSKWKK